MQTLAQTLHASFAVLAGNAIILLPNLLTALVLLWLGWTVGISFEKVIRHLVTMLRVDPYLEYLGLGNFLKRGGVKLDAGAFLGGLVKWFVAIAFLVAAFQMVGLTQVGVFLAQVILSYIPQVIIATILLLFAAVGARATQRFVRTSAKAFGVNAANLLGSIAHVSIWLVTIIFVLSQLGIAADFMKILFIGIVGMISLAGGLAFGLGGRDEAALLLAKMRKDASDHS